jgi:hypothetical protein
MDDSDETFGFIFADCGVASCGWSQRAAWIVIVPKHLPSLVAAPVDFEFNGRPDSFFRSNIIVSVQIIPAG